MYTRLLLGAPFASLHAVVAWSGGNHPLVDIVRSSGLVTALGLQGVSMAS